MESRWTAWTNPTLDAACDRAIAAVYSTIKLRPAAPRPTTVIQTEAVVAEAPRETKFRRQGFYRNKR